MAKKSNERRSKKTVRIHATVTASTQAVKDRDSRGRFIKGNVPKTTFKDRPQDRYDITKDDAYNPQHSPRHYLRKLWSKPRDEVKDLILASEIKKGMTFGEYLALKQANRARGSTKEFVATMNQAEGAPVQPVEMEITDKREKTPYDDLTKEQLRKLIGE